MADVLDLDGARAAVDRHRGELRHRGVSVIPGFVAPDAVAAMVAECDVLAAEAYHQDVQGTPYLERPDDGWPAGHPRTTWSRSSVHTLGYDQMPPTSSVRQVFERDDLLAFLSDVLGRSPLYRYADPIGALNVAVMVEGDELGWHFDQTDFVVSLAVQSSDGGGHFENVQRLRWTDEAGAAGHIDERYDEVAAVLAGETDERVTTVPMEPGTLMLFEGRWSLHRVSPVTGPTPRHVALFGYDTEPGTMSSELLKLIRYGRAA
jgi:hypothetical protein